MSTKTDVIIIGAGVAGLTAAIYAQRAGLHAIVLDKGTYGGQVAITNEIENYPGIQSVTGVELATAVYQQATAQGAEIRFEEVVSVQLNGTSKNIATSAGEYAAKVVILANGAKRRKLGIPGEEEFTGRGVSYCATCDGAFFRGKEVAVVGGGNTAIEDALFLANLCAKVTLIHRRESFTAEPPLIKAIQSKENVEILYNSAVEQVEGGNVMEHITVTNRKNDIRAKIPVNALFIAIGYEPDNSLFSPPVVLDEKGYFRAGEDCRTNIPGVYAAGDCRAKVLRQIITAASDGAIAAFQAGNQLNQEDE